MIELSIFNFKTIEFISIEWKIEILLKTKFTYKILIYQVHNELKL